jgi:hypothetical protein
MGYSAGRNYLGCTASILATPHLKSDMAAKGYQTVDLPWYR